MNELPEGSRRFATPDRYLTRNCDACATERERLATLSPFDRMGNSDKWRRGPPLAFLAPRLILRGRSAPTSMKPAKSPREIETIRGPGAYQD